MGFLPLLYAAKKKLAYKLGLEREYYHPEVPLQRIHDVRFRHTFFGYYDRSPWSPSERRLLYAATDTSELPNGAEDLVVGVYDIPSDEYQIVGRTPCWNFQQAAQQQWLDDSTIIYNAVHARTAICRIVDATTGAVAREFPFHSGIVHAGTRRGVSYSFARLQDKERDYGYPIVSDPDYANRIPEDPAIVVFDIDTGERVVDLSFRELLARHEDPASVEGNFLWIQHAKFNPSGSKILLVLRSRLNDEAEWTTAKIGSDLFVLDLDAGEVSHVLHNQDWRRGGNHPVWLDDTRIMMNLVPASDSFCRTVAFSRYPDDCEISLRGRLGTGHPTLIRNGTLVLTDHEYYGVQALVLHDTGSRNSTVIGRYPRAPQFRGPVRCDLHPRGNSDGTTVCFDSVMTGVRALYLADIRDV